MNYADKVNLAVKRINDSGEGIFLEPQHFFGDGVYVRVLSIPEGYAFIGKQHKTDHVFALISGKMAITDKDGNRNIYNAPYFFESKIGARRSLLALTDSIIMNAHACDTTKAIDEIEDFLTFDPSLKMVE